MRRYASPTVGWRLDGDLLAGMHGKHRNVVRKAQKAGVAVDVTAAPDDLSAFVALYEQTMERQDAAGYYFFPPGVLGAAHRARKAASSASTLWPKAKSSPRRSACAATAGSTTTSGRPPTPRAISAPRTSCSTRPRSGVRRRASRSSTSAAARERTEDSLFAFKQRFSPDGRREFWVGKLVHDEDAYRRLSGGAEIDYDGFFPAYRAASLGTHAGRRSRRLARRRAGGRRAERVARSGSRRRRTAPGPPGRAALGASSPGQPSRQSCSPTRLIRPPRLPAREPAGAGRLDRAEPPSPRSATPMPQRDSARRRGEA